MPDLQVPPSPPSGGGGGPIYEPTTITSDVAKTISAQTLNPQTFYPLPPNQPQIIGYPDPNYQSRTLVEVYGNPIYQGAEVSIQGRF